VLRDWGGGPRAREGLVWLRHFGKHLVRGPWLASTVLVVLIMYSGHSFILFFERNTVSFCHPVWDPLSCCFELISVWCPHKSLLFDPSLCIAKKSIQSFKQW
jgi:hypothetical protein